MGPRLSAGEITAAAAAGTASVALLAMRRRRRRRTFCGKSVLITGGARGLGLALARRFADEGADLFLVSRTPAELDRVRPELQARGAARVVPLTCDVRDPAAVHETVERVIRLAGKVDVLVNNAGIIQMTPFAHARAADFEESLRTHFWGPLFFIRACLPAMPRGGRIINISSIGGRIAVPHLLPYSVGKFALSALSDGLHAELAHEGISVTTATPGLMRTGSHRNVLVRGARRREAQWFGLGVTTSITSMNADRAARQILRAARRRRATVTPGWQARAAQIATTLAPETTAHLVQAVTRWLLPRPTGHGDADRAAYSRDLDLGWIAALLPTRAAVRLNQPLAGDER